jgi:hypothetical protein
MKIYVENGKFTVEQLLAIVLLHHKRGIDMSHTLIFREAREVLNSIKDTIDTIILDDDKIKSIIGNTKIDNLDNLINCLNYEDVFNEQVQFVHFNKALWIIGQFIKNTL